MGEGERGGRHLKDSPRTQYARPQQRSPRGSGGVVVVTAVLQTVSWCFAPRGHARACQPWESTAAILQTVFAVLCTPNGWDRSPLQAGADAFEGVP